MLALFLIACGGCQQDATPTTEAELEVTASPRVARLTHTQWENTVADLLALEAETGLSDAFLQDTLSEGFNNNAEALQVDAVRFQDYQRAAEELARLTVSDPDRYAAVVPQDPRSGGEEHVEVIEAEADGVVTTSGGGISSGWMLWSTGTLSADFELPNNAKYAVGAELLGSDCGDEVYATYELYVDDVLVGEGETTPTYTLYEHDVELAAGVHNVSVKFTNDCYDADAGNDRNLSVDYLQVRGSSLLGESTAGQAEAEAWIAAFGQRAWRRPLTDAEIETMTSLWQQGPEIFESGDDFADGVQLTLATMLQSPHFLYRVEASQETDEDGRIPLDDWEIAAKLSYALWNSMPDATLFEAAAAGELGTEAEVQAQAWRMLEDPRARAVVEDFHGQLMALDTYENIYKDPERFPVWSADLNSAMRREVELFVDEVVFQEQSGVYSLYAAPFTFVNADLAPVYGLDAGELDTGMERVELDPNERGGLLTQAGWLSHHADSTTPSSIHRGVFVNLEVLCRDLPDPPDNVTGLPGLDPDQTNRERVEAHTGDGTCGAGCHSTMINPPGFAFEAYDAMGQIRSEDNGKPVDASGTFSFDGGSESWTHGREFVEIIAQHPETHRCYAGHWLSWTHGRTTEAADDALLEELGAQSAEGLPIVELLVALVSSPSFRTRMDAE
ncbi:MAG: DUF1592 domain-containing protein [Myxococcota bacterium]|nr:DUF1592 domain-containing protein [Myxococcota bacterium]